jgi:hypothetical protein
MAKSYLRINAHISPIEEVTLKDAATTMLAGHTVIKEFFGSSFQREITNESVKAFKNQLIGTTQVTLIDLGVTDPSPEFEVTYLAVKIRGRYSPDYEPLIYIYIKNSVTPMAMLNKIGDFLLIPLSGAGLAQIELKAGGLLNSGYVDIYVVGN